MAGEIPYRQVRALYDDTTITIYQAYKTSIAEAAVSTQTLNASPDFRPGRMTWVKPSWCWMMYRAGYSFKDAGQSRILALKMRHEHFLELLRRGVLASHAHQKPKGDENRKRVATTEVRIQWDPERSPDLSMLPYRSIQIGIPGSLSDVWAKEWIVGIEDVTEKARSLKSRIDQDPGVSIDELVSLGLMPAERPFPVPEDIQARLEMHAMAPAAA